MLYCVFIKIFFTFTSQHKKVFMNLVYFILYVMKILKKRREKRTGSEEEKRYENEVINYAMDERIRNLSSI